MTFVTRTFSRGMAMLLMCALVAASAPFAEAKPLTQEKVHERILKRGIGNWVGVELQNGTAFAGRIVSADDESFGLQLHNDPAITPVRCGCRRPSHGDLAGGLLGIYHCRLRGSCCHGCDRDS